MGEVVNIDSFRENRFAESNYRNPNERIDAILAYVDQRIAYLEAVEAMDGSTQVVDFMEYREDKTNSSRKVMVRTLPKSFKGRK